MGTINYKTSDYITIGLKPYDRNDFTDDPGFMEWMQDYAESDGETIEQEIEFYLYSLAQDDYCNVENLLKNYSFYYFDVKIDPGYYEGFSIQIENNFSICFDSWQDKRDAQKEITELKQFLLDCAGCGLVQCFPGWCMGYNNYTETLEGIKNAVKAMREEVKNTPTWLWYERDQYK